MRNPLYLLLSLCISFYVKYANAQHIENYKSVEIKGLVTDTKKRPLQFATVSIADAEISTTSGAGGLFTLSIPKTLTKIKLSVSFVGMQSTELTIDSAQYKQFMIVALQNLGLTLSEVQISGMRRGGNASNSSYVFNSEAIKQLQAFSLADVLNKLPGKTTTAPQLHSPQAITLRTETTGEYAMSNSLGTAIIIDGIRLSNDANMQGRNVSVFGMAGSPISSHLDGGVDVPFTGIDLRNIPVDNIESIEVVTGVASAQYGDLTDGAIIINQKAGKTKYQFSAAFNEGSSNFSLSKGFGLGKKLGAINLELDYLNSNKDPTDYLVRYGRINTGLRWTANIGKRIKHTLSLGYNTKIDDVKIDPDDDALRKTYSKSRAFQVSERISLEFKKHWIKTIGLNLGYGSGYQDTYNQWLLNGPPRGIANKDTTGIYEGYFIPGNYLAEQRVIGKPISASANIRFSSIAVTGALIHHIKYGCDYSFSQNKGAGIVIAPDRPRWASNGGQGERPYNYEQEHIALSSIGFYAEDRVGFKLWQKALNATLGIRYDRQNGQPGFQPRINVRYQLNKSYEFNIAYGISLKSPTLAHRFPSPTWLDIPLLNLFTGQANQNLYLVHTQKVVANNSGLKPSASTQLETGLRFNGKLMDVAVFGYYKTNKKGFSTDRQYLLLTLPEYDYTYSPGMPISYFKTGNLFVFASPSYLTIANTLNSKNTGLELTMQIKKITAIQTSFSFNTVVSNSTFYDNSRRLVQVDQSQLSAERLAWYGVYNPLEYENFSIRSGLSSSTHISRLGFVITLSSDINWRNKAKASQSSREPVGYLTRDFKYVAIEKFDRANPDYGYLQLDKEQGPATQPDFVTASLNLGITKEVKESIRFSLGIYNLFNKTSVFYDADINKEILVTRPMRITVGFSLSL